MSPDTPSRTATASSEAAKAHIARLDALAAERLQQIKAAQSLAASLDQDGKALRRRVEDLEAETLALRNQNAARLHEMATMQREHQAAMHHATRFQRRARRVAATVRHPGHAVAGALGQRQREPADASGGDPAALIESIDAPTDAGQGLDAAWYLATYPDVATSGLSAADHFRLFGQAEGRFPNGSAVPEVPVPEGPEVDEDWYLATYPDVAASGQSAADHFRLLGQAEGRFPNRSAAPEASEPQPEPPEVDEAWYLATYPDVVVSGQSAADHFRLFGQAEDRFSNGFAAAEAHTLGLPEVDEPWYLATYPDVAASGLSATDHFRLFGQAEGRATNALEHEEILERTTEFDRDYYLRHNPDIARMNVDPLWHFENYGRAEGREGRVAVAAFDTVVREIDPGRETVLLISHDGSRTGAPILALNVLRHLQSRYNVVAILLGPGIMAQHFATVAAVTITLEDKRHIHSEAVHRPVAEAITAYRPRAAFANSIQTAQALVPLADARVPVVMLVHEFASYIRPLATFRDAARLATELVFPAEIVWDDVVHHLGELEHRSVNIVTPGASTVPRNISEGDRVAELTAIRTVMRPPDHPRPSLCIMGAGTVEYRKGVDQFIEVAGVARRLAPDLALRFIWIGKGFDPVEDPHYAAFLDQQIVQSGLQDRVVFLDEVAQLDLAFGEADLFFLSSRLDPFPNVGIDAMLAGLPLVCFDRASGLAELLKTDAACADCVIPGGATELAAARIVAMARNEAQRSRTAEALRALAVRSIDMAAYVDRIDALATRAASIKAQEVADIATIEASSLFDESFFGYATSVSIERGAAVQAWVRDWAAGLPSRRPLPGFDEAAYAARHPALREGPIVNPLAHFIRAGHPRGPWSVDLVPGDRGTGTQTGNGRVGLLIDGDVSDAVALADAVCRNSGTLALLFAEHHRGAAAELEAELAVRGRTIDVRVLSGASPLGADYDVVGRMALDAEPSRFSWAYAQWRDLLVAHMVGTGDAPMIDVVADRFRADPRLALVTVEDPRTGTSTDPSDEDQVLPSRNSFWLHLSRVAAPDPGGWTLQALAAYDADRERHARVAQTSDEPAAFPGHAALHVPYAFREGWRNRPDAPLAPAQITEATSSPSDAEQAVEAS